MNLFFNNFFNNTKDTIFQVIIIFFLVIIILNIFKTVSQHKVNYLMKEPLYLISAVLYAVLLIIYFVSKTKFNVYFILIIAATILMLRYTSYLDSKRISDFLESKKGLEKSKPKEVKNTVLNEKEIKIIKTFQKELREEFENNKKSISKAKQEFPLLYDNYRNLYNLALRLARKQETESYNELYGEYAFYSRQYFSSMLEYYLEFNNLEEKANRKLFNNKEAYLKLLHLFAHIEAYYLENKTRDNDILLIEDINNIIIVNFFTNPNFNKDEFIKLENEVLNKHQINFSNIKKVEEVIRFGKSEKIL